MEGNRGHRPQRFELYTELKNGKGFTIPNCDFVFKFDRRGGWFDQFGNYYDKNGDPDSAPEDNSEGSYGSRSDHSDYEDDPYEREYGGPRNVEDQHDEADHVKGYGKVNLSLNRLEGYPEGATRVYFKNIPYVRKQNQILDQFRRKVVGVVDVFIERNDKGQFNGNGHFIVENLAAARALVKLHGGKFFGREVYFDVDLVEDFLHDRLSADQTRNLKQHKEPEVKKEVKKSVPAQKKQEVKKEEVRVEKKGAQDPQEWMSFKFCKAAFPKKTSFKDWLVQNKFDIETDLKQVEKIEGDEQNAKVTMRRKVYTKLNNAEYGGKKIVFRPL